MSLWDKLLNFFTALFRRPFSNNILVRPIFAAIIIGVVCSIVGVFMVLRGLIFFGNGIAHSAFAGGALGLLLGINILYPVSIFALITALGIGYIREKTKLSNETSIGILFALTMALGIIFISLYNNYNVSVSSLLFGSLSSVNLEELLLTLGFAIVIVITMVIMGKWLYFSTFDEELAQANGIPTRLISYIFLVIVALTVIMGIRVVGIILIMAFVVTPAAAAYQYTYDIKKMVVYSVIISFFCAIAAFPISYVLEISASATIVVLLTIVFIFSMAFSPKRRKHSIPEIDSHLCNVCEEAIGDSYCMYCEMEDTEESPETATQDHEHVDEHHHVHDHSQHGGHHHE
ncbi:MAG: metal ABC transporter permease [Candidatus Lokiarchaeota archaeon]|nr:metal ABC transporter permease [Candidatus Lokiarchaeota archaeon]